MAFLRLGWRFPRPNDFSGPDQRPTKDTFGNLQKHMTWPYVGLRFDGTMNLAGTAPIPMTIKTAAANPFVYGDPYNLWRSATNTIQCPRDFDTWMLIAAVAGTTTGGATTAVFSLGWRIDGVTDVWLSHATGFAGSRLSVPIIIPIRKGQTLQPIAASTDATEDLTDAEAWALFLPLG